MNAWLAIFLCIFFSGVAAFGLLRWEADRMERPMIFASLGILGDLVEIALILGSGAGLLSGGVWSHQHVSWYAFPATALGIAVLLVLLIQSMRFRWIAWSALGPVISVGVVVWVNWWMWFGKGAV